LGAGVPASHDAAVLADDAPPPSRSSAQTTHLSCIVTRVHWRSGQTDVRQSFASIPDDSSMYAVVADGNGPRSRSGLLFEQHHPACTRRSQQKPVVPSKGTRRSTLWLRLRGLASHTAVSIESIIGERQKARVVRSLPRPHALFEATAVSVAIRPTYHVH
jgi:hypothetical protein